MKLDKSLENIMGNYIRSNLRLRKKKLNNNNKSNLKYNDVNIKYVNI